jgi:hypothetical protein
MISQRTKGALAARSTWWKVVPCCHRRLSSRDAWASTLDGLCDLPGGLGGREVCGVDDLGLAM